MYEYFVDPKMRIGHRLRISSLRVGATSKVRAGPGGWVRAWDCGWGRFGKRVEMTFQDRKQEGGNGTGSLRRMPDPQAPQQEAGWVIREQ